VTLCECGAKAHARGMCSLHYMRWYNEHRDEVRRVKAPKQKYWKFTPAHWWKWWEDRLPNERTAELRAGIQMLRYMLR